MFCVCVASSLDRKYIAVLAFPYNLYVVHIQGGVEREQGLIQILTELDGFQSSNAKVWAQRLLHMFSKSSDTQLCTPAFPLPSLVFDDFLSDFAFRPS